LDFPLLPYGHIDRVPLLLLFILFIILISIFF